MMPARIGGHERVDIGFDQGASVELLVAQALIELHLLRFHLLACGIIGADQQVADDGAQIVAQRRDRYNGRKAAAVLADVGQLVDVFDSARGFENQCLEAWRDRRVEFGAQRHRAGDHFLRVGNVCRSDLVYHVGGCIAQHAFGADIENLNDAFLVGGDAGEVGAIENGILQRPSFQQSLFAAHLGDGRDSRSVGHMILHVYLALFERSSKAWATASDCSR